ncbi:MAG: phosphoribosylformylglycinamidine cyclo-ligase [Propionibacteriaceae bacterium]|jgi:phosphoribosylformylglycinamidine cyclo-ligase|nr:phosphoribosylformylglycinamidine cyclo-ligase [Propionibacteriaceae bacterium]
MTKKTAYAHSGVDIEAGDRAVELMKKHILTTTREEVLGGFGGFAGLFDISRFMSYRHPVLATSTDGVGTKVSIAQAMDIHDTVGIDLVGMLVDDVVVTGAEPLFLTDYIACGSVVPETIEQIVKGVARGCVEAGVALIGGETAEHPGLLDPDEYDLAGATTGVVEKDKILGSHLVCDGDRLVCVASSGLHSNGFSLVRHVLLTQARWSLDRHVDDLGSTLGEELLTPTRIYAKSCLDVAGSCEIHAMSHITGGGLANNVARVLPENLGGFIDRSTWAPQPIFTLIQSLGGVSQPDIEETLNMGVGMVMICPESSVNTTLNIFSIYGIPAWDGGQVTSRNPDQPQIELIGEHR